MSGFKHREEKDCLNCGYQIDDKFCSHCGQENIVVKENAWHMITHAIADYFHFEHKFFATMRPLLLKPGLLTKEYVAGKRVSFIHPIRLYIFISIVFFIVILSKSESEKTNTNTNVNIKDKKETTVKRKRPKKSDAQMRTDSVIKKHIRTGLKYVPMNAEEQKEVDKELAKMDEDIDMDTTFIIGPSNGQEGFIYTQDSTYEAYINRVNKLPKDKQPGTAMKYLAKNQIKFRGEDGKKRFIESLLHNLPKMMFIFLPLFAAILHLVYIRKRKYYYEDLIYSFHLHSSIFLAILLYKLLNWLIGYAVDINGWLIFLLVIYITWYIYRSLRVFYNSSRWRTLVKLFFLFFAYMFLLSISAMIIVSYTVIAL